MKMTKKIFMVAIATCAFALTGCMGMDGFGGDDAGSKKQSGTKYNLTVKAIANNDAEKGSKKYQRAWEQLGTKETVQAIETKLMIDTTAVQSKISVKSGTKDTPDATYVVDPDGTITTNAVVGLIFDLHQTKTKTVEGKTQKVYDFILVGYRPSDNGYYVEHYTDITEDLFKAATNDTGFGTVTKYITASEAGYVYAKDNSWVTSRKGKLGKDDNGKEYNDEVDLKEFTVKVTQEVPGTYVINVAGESFTYKPAAPADEELKAKWYNKDGYRIGGAGYYVNAPLGTEVKANFKSNKETTIGLEEEVDE